MKSFKHHEIRLKCCSGNAVLYIPYGINKREVEMIKKLLDALEEKVGVKQK